MVGLSALLFSSHLHFQLMFEGRLSDLNGIQGHTVFLFVFFAFPSYISGVHHFWVRFLRM